jgi:hypothetical protein
MEIKQRTKRELEKGRLKIDKFIARHGIGSGYLSKARRIQRGINVALLLGTVTTIAGLMTWAFYNQDKK